MDGIFALCHFCETHGPCVILCTQRCLKDPHQVPHALTVPPCEACRSIDINQAYISKNAQITYITTRTPQEQHLDFLLKQAAIRGLSCEEEISKDGGVMYFGDNERGHAVNYSFILKDSLARGFYRKYSLLLLMQDKLHLLNMWPILVQNMKKIIIELQTKAEEVNKTEQMHCSQRIVRQVQGSPKTIFRSLPQLTGQPAVFGRLHLWFTWILNYEVVAEDSKLKLSVPQSYCPNGLITVFSEMEIADFRTVVFAFLTGHKLEADEDVILSFKILLPHNWEPANNALVCKIKKDTKWTIEWSGSLPIRLPTFQTILEKALKDQKLPKSALGPLLHANVTKWFNISKSIEWSNGLNNKQLLQALGVQKHDMPLISYWVSHCSVLNKY